MVEIISNFALVGPTMGVMAGLTDPVVVVVIGADFGIDGTAPSLNDLLDFLPVEKLTAAHGAPIPPKRYRQDDPHALRPCGPVHRAAPRRHRPTYAVRHRSRQVRLYLRRAVREVTSNAEVRSA